MTKPSAWCYMMSYLAKAAAAKGKEGPEEAVEKVATTPPTSASVTNRVGVRTGSAWAGPLRIFFRRRDRNPDTARGFPSSGYFAS